MENSKLLPAEKPVQYENVAAPDDVPALDHARRLEYVLRIFRRPGSDPVVYSSPTPFQPFHVGDELFEFIWHPGEMGKTNVGDQYSNPTARVVRVVRGVEVVGEIAADLTHVYTEPLNK